MNQGSMTKTDHIFLEVPAKLAVGTALSVML
jgi:hypothetical protein